MDSFNDMFDTTDKPLSAKRPKKKVYTVESKDKQAKLTKKEIDALEKEVEDYLCQRVKDCGLDQRKLNPQGCRGIPDRLVFDPTGGHNPQFVETKREFKSRASAMQIYLAKGLKTLFIYSKEEVEYFLFHYFTRKYKKPAKSIVDLD